MAGPDPKRALLKVWVQPRAPRTGVTGRHGDAIKIKLAAPPVDGAANKELVRFLAESLGLPRSAIVIVRGGTSRGKTVEITGMEPEAIQDKLLGPAT